MPTFILDKLVRTGLPEIYIQKGQQPTVEEVTGCELIESLVAKLHEEIQEYQAGERNLEGLADILQVCVDSKQLNIEGDVLAEVERVEKYVYAQMQSLGFDFNEVESARIRKLELKKGFINQDKDGRWIGVKVTKLVLNEDDPWVAYYRNEPERFPETKE